MPLHLICIALACGAAAFGPVLPASAIFGEAEIAPIESNLSAKSWANVEVSSGTSTADLAIDQDERTAWITDGESRSQWLTLDLGGAYDNVRKVRVVFPDAGAVYQYVVEASADGTRWDVIADHSASRRPGRGSVDLFTHPGTRYVRVKIIGASPGASVGVSELSVYNYLRDELVLGSDSSWVDNDVAEGRNYWVNPLDADRGAGPHLLDVLKDRGFEYTRLRVFNEPRSESTGDLLATPYQGPERSAEVAKWVKARDMGLGIDFHYADSWADPSKQPKPRAWAQLPFGELTKAVYDIDVIAHSYYPQWHGSQDYYESVVNAVAAAHPKYKIEVAETSYPAAGGGGAPMPNSPYPRTVQGQADAFQRVFQIVNDIPNNQGLGVLAWEPARWESLFRAVPGLTRTYEPNASIDVYTKSQARHVVQDTVYSTALVGDDVVLPGSVRALTAADGSTRSVPVQWASVPDDATDAAGRLTVRGSTEFGSVTAVVDVVEAYKGLECDRVITGRYAGQLTVTDGVTCLRETVLSGPVSVRPGASLRMDGAVIAGPVQADHASAVVICDTRISGPVTASGNTSVTLGNALLGCAPNEITGPVTVSRTQLWNVIAGNAITGPLSCSGNAVPPVNNGFTNSVTGPRSGQCSRL